MTARVKLSVSTSGGLTSAFMAKRLHDEYSDMYEMVFPFANTGLEREETLVFVERLRDWGIECVWLEAVVHHGERIGSTHRIVNFETASRKGEPFEEVIKKYGIPNKAYLHCTRELKLNPIRSYLASIGWDGYFTAVGIRTDEPIRIRADAFDARIIYPLVSMFPTDKSDVVEFWQNQSFHLGLQSHEGNCEACFKKSTSKLVRIAQDRPQAFDFPARMEATYGLSGRNIDGTKRTFFREHRSAKDIIAMAEMLTPLPLERAEENAGCAESCEAFA